MLNSVYDIKTTYRTTVEIRSYENIDSNEIGVGKNQSNFGRIVCAIETLVNFYIKKCHDVYKRFL